MHRRRFNKLMKRRVSPHLFLATGARAARFRRVHPDALMVCERDLQGHVNFVCALTQGDKYSPREPLERDITWLQSMDMDRIARGRKGWVDEITNGQMAEQDSAEAESKRELEELFDNEIAPRARHLANQGRTYATGKA